MNQSNYNRFEGEGPGIALWSHLDPAMPQDVIDALMRPHRSPNYFLMFVNRGSVKYSVDLREVNVSEGQVLFIKPRQVRIPPKSKGDAEYFKVIFDERAHALLPRIFRFWLDPLAQQKVEFPREAWKRMDGALALLRTSLRTAAAPSLRVAYLYAVLQEIEEVYFGNVPEKIKRKQVHAFMEFQNLVEEMFFDQPSVAELAGRLGRSETSLYNLVKGWTDVSPKEYLNRRIVLEAQRLLLYSGLSVKELARRLGFADENYLSRVFRKRTGYSITEFLAQFEEISR